MNALGVRERDVFTAALDLPQGTLRFSTGAQARSVRQRAVNLRVGAITASIRGTDLWGTADQDGDRICLLEGGITVVHPQAIIGWAEKPAYDATTHRLVWSLAARDKGSAPGDAQTINYNTYMLGREGYITMNPLVTGSDAIATDKAVAHALLGALSFNPGKTYADFNEETDKVAAYGLAALVAGVAAKKLGLFAVIAAFLAKFAKVFLVAGAAGGAALWKKLRGKAA